MYHSVQYETLEVKSEKGVNLIAEMQLLIRSFLLLTLSSNNFPQKRLPQFI